MHNNFAQNKTGFSLLSPIGSAVSLLCFFAPWVGCDGASVSGSNLGDEFWLVFLSSLISLGSYFLFRSKGALSKAKKPILFSSLFGLGFLIIKYIDFVSSDLHYTLEIKWGSIATLLGFILTLVGINFLQEDEIYNISTEDVEIYIYCGNCGKQYPADSKKNFCEKCGNAL